MSNGKTNRYGFLFYPESLDFNAVFGTLRATHTKAMISPLHDSDVWMADDCFRRCLDLWRNDSDGFLTIERETHSHVITQDGIDNFVCITQEDSIVCKNRKQVKLSDFLVEVTNDDTGEIRYLNALADYKFAEAVEWTRYSVASVVNLVWHPKRGDDSCLPIVGEKKKPHYHVIVKFDYSMTPSQALNKLGIEDSISYLEPINSESGYIRYLCHMDDLDKAQYSETDVISLGGYSCDPLYIQGAVDQELATQDLYEIAQDVRKRGGDFKEMLDVVMGCDWKTRKAFRSNQSMWRSYLYRPILTNTD